MDQKNEKNKMGQNLFCTCPEEGNMAEDQRKKKEGNSILNAVTLEGSNVFRRVKMSENFKSLCSL